MPTGRPKKQPNEQRNAMIRARVTDAVKESVGHEARLHGISEGEYVRRRLGFGAPASRPKSITAIEKRGVDIAELFSREYIRGQADAAGISEAQLVRRMLEFAASPPARQQTVALISEINRLGLELKAIGNNANQLALAAHTNRRFATSWKDVVREIRELRDKVDDALDKVLEADD